MLEGTDSTAENELLESVDAGEWKAVADKEGELRRFQEYARATFRKDQGRLKEETA